MTDETTPAEPTVDRAIAADPRTRATARLGWVSLAIAALFGLFYAYDVWEAIGNLIGVPESYQKIGISPSTPWVLLVVALALPLVVYGLAFVIGLRRNLGEKALLFLAGLAITNALGLGAIALEYLIYTELLAGFAS
jgi:hypothetical protein